MPKLWRLAVTAAAIGLLLALWYASGMPLPAFWHDVGDQSASEDAGSARVIPVNTLVAVRTPSYEQTRVLTGLVRARRSGDLSFSRPGKLVRLLVDQGDQVKSGDAVAELDTRRLTEQKTKLENARDRAEEDLTKLIADSRFKSMESIRIEVRELQSQIDELSTTINRSSEGQDATSPPPGRGPSTGDRLEGAQQRLRALAATSRDPNVSAQQKAIAELEQQIAQLETEISESTLRAPFDGTIALRYVSDGILVSPEVPIMQLVERDALQVWVGLPADAAQDVTVGQTQVIEVGGQELDAVALAKLPELDRTTRTRTVIFTLDASASAQTLPGQLARIELDRQVDQPGFWLPLTSLTRESRGLWSVYVVDRDDDNQQVVSRRYVEVMHLEGDRARVRGTLDDGDLVIADGTHRVVPGQQVESVRTAESGP